MFWKKNTPVLSVALGRLDAEVEADLQIVIETHEDYDLARRIVSFAKRKSLPIKTWRVYLPRESEAAQKMGWLLDIERLGVDVELYCHDPSRTQKLLTRHRSKIRVLPIAPERANSA